MKKKLTIAIPHDYEAKCQNIVLNKLAFGKQKILLSNEELANLE